MTPHVFTNRPAPIFLSDQTRLIMLNAQAVDGPAWSGLDEERLCDCCQRAFTGREVLIYQELFSPSPDFDLVCPSRGCEGGPGNWVKLEGLDLELFGRRAVGDREEGDFGFTLRLVPKYRDPAQREALRPLLWDRPWKEDSMAARPNVEFARVLLTGCREITLWSLAGRHDLCMEAARRTGFYPVVRLEAIDNHAPSGQEELFLLTVEIVCSLQVLAGNVTIEPESAYRGLQTALAAPRARQTLHELVRQTVLAVILAHPEVDAEGFGWNTSDDPDVPGEVLAALVEKYVPLAANGR